VSTPEERLKQEADRLKARKAQQEREKQEEAARAEKDLQQRAARARVEQKLWRNRVEQLVQATGQQVPFSVDETHEGAGFDVTVGTARIRMLLATEGWRVVDSSPTTIGPSSALPLLDLARVRDQTLEDMVQQGLRDLSEGRVSPGPRR
jgi:hypothetical protein